MTARMGRNRILASMVVWFVVFTGLASMVLAEGDDRDTAVLDQHDGLRIFAGSACGDARAGREAVLENLRDDTARVVVEASGWRGETFEESHRQRFSLDAKQQVRLGCTRQGSVAFQYSILRVLDDAVPPDPVGDRWTSSRAFVVLTETGTCGGDSEGRRIAVGNRHQDRDILVFIEVVKRVGGRFRGRSMTSYKLGPGDEQEVGCDREGEVEREFYLVETD